MDHEHWLCGFALPAPSRRAYFAVRALNIELANVKEITTDPARAAMRILWWKEVLKDVYNVP